MYSFIHYLIIGLLFYSCMKTQENKLSEKMVDSKSRNNKEPVKTSFSDTSVIKLEEILELARLNINVPCSNAATIGLYKEFDFENFQPLTETDSSDGTYFKVERDSRGEITKISKHSLLEFDNFEFCVVNAPPLKILFIDEFDDKQHSKADSTIKLGFIFRYKNKCYFIGETYSIHPYFKSTDYISTIMILDKKLNPDRTLKLDKSEIKYRTLVNYSKKGAVVSELVSPINEIYKIRGETLLESVLEIFSSKAMFGSPKNKKIRLLDEYSYLPLWIYDGNHVYY